MSPEELDRADTRAAFALKQIASQAAAGRLDDLRQQAEGAEPERLVDIRAFGDRGSIDDEGWRTLSETALFRRKRAEQLVPLVAALREFRDAGLETHPSAALCELLTTTRGRKTVSFVLAEIRKRKLATEVADLAVCGAIAPYNHLIGGKLVALLAASEEAREMYARRYSGQASEIASQIAGRRITRSADLKVITTTSLYGVGSSQYNRLTLEKQSDSKLRFAVRYEELGISRGFSVTHLSRDTVQLMRKLGIAAHGARRINSVFGEGSSPRVRQIREGLNLIGINDDHVLKHQVGRRVYACELYPGAKEDLIGFAPSKGQRKAASASAVSRGWARRWLAQRIGRAEVLRHVASSGPASVRRDLRERAARARIGAEENTERLSDTQLNLSLGRSAEFAEE
jgi:hypothetical protein